MITAERLREAVSYNPETGEFSWKAPRPGRQRERIGTIWNKRGSPGYLKIGIDGTQYLAHRLVWLYLYDRWPAHEIDHINGDGLDNRLANLREATRAQNATNATAQKSSKSGLRGVHFHPGAKRYRAQIQKHGKSRHLGYFNTPEEAHAAYLAAATELHGPFVRGPT